MKKKQNSFRSFAYLGILLLLVLVILYSGLQVLESTIFYNNDEVPVATESSKTITIDGTSYFPRQDITILLVSGIDQTGPMESSNSFNNAGAVDMISLVIFDETNKNTRVLTLNRDTMTDVPVLAINGQVARTRFQQLALAHSYGSGMEDSSENVVRAVSSLLNGIWIDHYITINMDAIKILNDSVGGVTVTIKDDFSRIDPDLPMGKVTLKGDHAINYIRSRHDVGDQLNVSRMERHKEYMQGYMQALGNAVRKDSSFALKLYDELGDYMVTDCSATVLNSMLNRYIDYPIVEYVSPEGENTIGTSPFGEQHYEYHLDEAKFDELILRLFYNPKD